MKKLYIPGMALLALFAFSVVLASTASAAVVFLLAEWLEGGGTISTPLLVDQEGEINFVNLDGGGLGIVSEILCSRTLDGTVGAVGNPSEDSITSLLSLNGEEISGTPLTGLALVCANSKNCTEPLVWIEELPFKTELELMEDPVGTNFFVDLLSNWAFYSECLIDSISVNELCTAPTTAIEITNEAGGSVDAVFSDAFQELAELKLGSCGGRAEETVVEGLETILLTSGGTLAASSGT